MLSTFIETREFTRNFESLGYNDDDLRRLQLTLLANPNIGDVMKGCGGLRKMRFSRDNRGRSGGVRVCYFNMPSYELIFLVVVFAKNDQENLTHEQRNNIYKAVNAIKREVVESEGFRK